jgi:predicted small lipoprotein YifL
MRKLRHAPAALVLLAGLAACGDGGALPTESSPAAEAAAGKAPANQQLAAMLAAALREPGVRAAIYREMQASPQVERKVLLGAFLRGRGAGVLEAMARSAPSGNLDGVLNLIRATGPLEVYFPIAAHRDAWKGDAELMVATTLDENAAPVGITLDGRTSVLSAVVAPAMPTLVVVPAEGFDRFGAPRDASLRSEFRRPSASRGLVTALGVNDRDLSVSERANYLKTTNDQEAWALGLPEFEISLAATTADGTQYDWVKPVPSQIFAPNSDDGLWKTAGTNSFEMIYWNQDYGTNVGFKCMEIDDVGSNVTITFTGGSTFKVGGLPVNVGISASWSSDSSDDACGVDYIYPRINDPNSASFYNWTELPGTTGNPEDGTSTFMYRHF